MILESEDIIIKKAISGDDGAFETLVRTYESFVYNVAYQSLKSQDDAFDVSQEVFIKVYKSLGSFRGDCKFSTWIYRVAQNVVKDFLRSKGNKLKTVSVYETDSDGEEHQLEIVDESTAADPIASFEKKECATLVREAISRLSEEQRTVIVLRDMEGYTYEEIAEMLFLDMGTVKSRINRGRNAIKKFLSERNIF